MPPTQPLARKPPRIARQLFPAGSTEQAAHPAAALTGFFIAKSGYRSLYCHLSPIHRQGLQLQLSTLNDQRTQTGFQYHSCIFKTDHFRHTGDAELAPLI